MKKRLLCLAFTLFMVLSSMQAVGIVAEATGENLIASFGSFNKAEDINYMQTSKAEVSWVSGDSAVGSGGCLKVSVLGSYGYSFVTVPNVIGETYDITFYAKTGSGEEKTLDFIPMTPAGGWDASILVDTYTTGWKRYTCSYTCDGAFASGGPSTAISLFNVRHGNGTDLDTYYLDELSIVPRGYVSYDWSTYQPMDVVNHRDVYPADDGFSTPQPENKATFTDTDNHWAEKQISLLASSNYVEGVGNGAFEPDREVNRAEFLTMVMKLVQVDNSSYKGMYWDVKPNDWFADTVQTAYELGLLDKLMVAGRKFRPEQAITRQEAATIISRIAMTLKERPSDSASISFTDESSIAEWARMAVKDVVAYGIMNGYPEGTFGPKGNVTRAEAANMIYHSVELNTKMAFFVDSVDGNDNNAGTPNAPLKTIDAARAKVQPYLADMQSHIYVYIKEGTYRLQDEVVFTTADSGTNGYSVIYTSWNDEKPVISGGTEYSGFEIHDATKNIYKTYVGTGTVARQVYINGVRGTRARTPFDYFDTDHVFTNGEMNYNGSYYTSDDTEYVNFKNKSDMEFVFFESWTNPRVGIKNITLTSDGKAKFQMEETHWKMRSAGGNTGWSYPVYIENAYELLDEKGEWYLNKSDGYLYYMPRDYENPATMTATIPYEELGFVVAGDSADKKVHNIKFDNLSFKYFTWTWPETSTVGFQDSQGNVISAYAGDGRITGGKEDAPLIILDAAYIDVTNSEFSKLGGSGATCRGVFQHVNFSGNHVYDISGTGVNVGIQEEDLKDFMNDVQPTDYKYFKAFNQYNNNLIHDVGIEYAAGPGFNVSFPKRTEMKHNEVYNTGYGGWHVGWGWGSYTTAINGLDITHNYIHDVLNSETFDSGGIYTLGATSANSEDYNQIANNYFENPRKPYGAIYPDEGSTGWEIQNNVVDMREADHWYTKMVAFEDPKWLHVNVKDSTVNKNSVHSNYSTTASYKFATGASMNSSQFENATVYANAAWPAAAQTIVNEAGLESEYTAQYPDSIERIRIDDHGDMLRLAEGTTRQLNVSGYKRKMNEVAISTSDLDFYSTNENVATVDANGLITVVGRGNATIYVEYLAGDVVKKQHVNILCNPVEVGHGITYLEVEDYVDQSTYTTADGDTAKGKVGRNSYAHGGGFLYYNTSPGAISADEAVEVDMEIVVTRSGNYDVGVVTQKNFGGRVNVLVDGTAALTGAGEGGSVPITDAASYFVADGVAYPGEAALYKASGVYLSKGPHVVTMKLTNRGAAYDNDFVKAIDYVSLQRTTNTDIAAVSVGTGTTYLELEDYVAEGTFRTPQGTLAVGKVYENSYAHGGKFLHFSTSDKAISEEEFIDIIIPINVTSTYYYKISVMTQSNFGARVTVLVDGAEVLSGVGGSGGTAPSNAANYFVANGVDYPGEASLFSTRTNKQLSKGAHTITLRLTNRGAEQGNDFIKAFDYISLEKKSSSWY